MKKYILILASLIPFSYECYGQNLSLKKSKTPIFQSGEWVMDISEIKIYDDDLIFGRVEFNQNKLALDTIRDKTTKDNTGRLDLSTYVSYPKNEIVSEAGDGMINFYSTKFKKKYSRDFLYFVSSVDNLDYLTIIIDIENSGTFYPMIFSITKIMKEGKKSEVQLLDTRKQFSDFRLVRIQQ